MKLTSILGITLVSLISSLSESSTECCSNEKHQEPMFPCVNKGGELLEKFLGDWNVEARDRIALDEYENNKGTAKINWLISGCGLKIAFDGLLRGEPFQFHENIIARDSINYQKTYTDSEHSSISLYEGQFANNKLTFLWKRKLPNRTLTVRHVIKNITKNSFEFASHISPKSDGEWQLTHSRRFTRQ